MDTLLKVLQIVPALISVMKAVEELMPQSGKGKEKLQLVESIMQESYDKLEEIWPTLVKVISKMVELFNSFGVFKKAES